MSHHGLSLRGNSSMHSPTRSRQHESLSALARVTRLQKVLRLTSLEKMELFIALAGHNGAIARVIEDLDISLPSRTGYPALVLRELLRLPRNIETLTLHLPSTSPPTILNGLLFPRLTVLTTNLPHHCLVSFLTAHPGIVSLTVQACGARHTCPLRDLNLGRMSQLQCPARCLAGIAHGHVTSATVNLTCMTSMAAVAINALSTSPLWTLTIDFFADDYDILTRIAGAAPNLRKLKLLEKPRAQRRFHHTRRPWNDVHQWHLTLLRLPYLEELLLRTHLTVTGPRRSEDTVVSAWANGALSRTTRHPNLFHIALLQGTGVAAGQRLSHWFKTGSAWERISSMVVGSTHSFVV
ncbi:hypothetical protein K466DRAFT_605346 [Polyporus arcularius HHB13444]|uniref:F-box domain-containing protein n=1 Tax=Polyporus arcularius HHB13444 TaxID=1314778 RepID=A0A5C3NTV0_9APHY|nr:hypothetical protein K466DRAFT_605346 [Polyporus arcularius HHB13444]